VRFINEAKVVFTNPPIYLMEHMKNQEALIHGEDYKRIGGVPKLLHVTTSALAMFAA
jgi:hypothetical protein